MRFEATMIVLSCFFHLYVQIRIGARWILSFGCVFRHSWNWNVLRKVTYQRRKGKDVIIEEAHIQMKAISRTGKITKYRKSWIATCVYHVSIICFHSSYQNLCSSPETSLTIGRFFSFVLLLHNSLTVIAIILTKLYRPSPRMIEMAMKTCKSKCSRMC